MIELKNRIKKILQEETNSMLYYCKKNINENELRFWINSKFLLDPPLKYK